MPIEKKIAIVWIVAGLACVLASSVGLFYFGMNPGSLLLTICGAISLGYAGALCARK